MSEEGTRAEWLKEVLLSAGQQTINSVGAGRGGNSKSIYLATFAQYFCGLMQSWDENWVGVTNWPVVINVDKGNPVDDKSFPFALMLFKGDDQVIKTLQNDPIEYRDLAAIPTLDMSLFAPILTVDLNWKLSEKPFSGAEINQLISRSLTIESGLAAALNFGKAELRSFLPDNYWADYKSLPLPPDYASLHNDDDEEDEY